MILFQAIIFLNFSILQKFYLRYLYLQTSILMMPYQLLFYYLFRRYQILIQSLGTRNK